MSDVGFGFTGSGRCLQQTQSHGGEFARRLLPAELQAATCGSSRVGFFSRVSQRRKLPVSTEISWALGKKCPPPASGDEGHSEPCQPQLSVVRVALSGQDYEKSCKWWILLLS